MRRTLFGFFVTICLLSPHIIYAQNSPFDPSAQIISIAWSPDGTRIAASFGDAKIKVWTWGETSELGSPFLIFQPDVADTVEWTPDGKFLIVDGQTAEEQEPIRAQVTKWDANTGQLADTLLDYHLDTTFEFNPYGYFRYPVIAFDRTFTRSAFSLNSREALLSDDRVIRVENIESEIIRQILWSPDAGSLAIVYGTGENYRIQTFDVETGDLINTIWGPDYYVTDIRWSPDNSMLAVSSEWVSSSPPSSNVRIYSINPGRDYFSDEDRFWAFDDIYSAAIAWHPQENLLAIASTTDVEIYEMSLENPLADISIAGVTHLDWSPNGERLAGALADGTIKIWEIEILG